ncbi:uncharacterized protein E5676_scaffold134G004210 [Cucumis melo var. makuwa]|uniref:Uncharacterized protein n=1 Tax=Cucumis melo var. makuwa TaxID=1194695 RepID=A0A5D3D9P5_CUCMM|nr:uncharacterized protein E6C27_scaffold255G00040 [Cucumis melo var. makuwa]TYK20281.1 uncharacterized protein E5676_scaffold134G004210 [Cucumis melo var. makuwa]
MGTMRQQSICTIQSRAAKHLKESEFPGSGRVLCFEDLGAHFKRWKQKMFFLMLQKKFDTEEARSKKYGVGRYLRYQMADDRSVET